MLGQDIIVTFVYLKDIGYQIDCSNVIKVITWNNLIMDTNIVESRAIQHSIRELSE